MNRSWDGNIPIGALFAQVNNTAEFTIYVQHPLADNNKVQAVEIMILKMSIIGTEYKDWRSHLEVKCTWNFFQDFEQQQYNLRQETKTAAGTMGYGNNI